MSTCQEDICLICNKNYYFNAYENKSKYIRNTVYLCFDKHYAVCPPYPNYCNDCERIIY